MVTMYCPDTDCLNNIDKVCKCKRRIANGWTYICDVSLDDPCRKVIQDIEAGSIVLDNGKLNVENARSPELEDLED